jgi:hypothetical protein
MIGVSQTVCAFEIQLPVGYLMLSAAAHTAADAAAADAAEAGAVAPAIASDASAFAKACALHCMESTPTTTARCAREGKRSSAPGPRVTVRPGPIKHAIIDSIPT